MSVRDGGFLGRWARLKAETRMREAEAEAEAAPAEADAACEVPEEAFDPESLPPLESLGADSDYAAFLAKGVPKALRNAALRRAWSTDPVIRDYRTPADYDWDFNAPGYAALRPGDDPRKLVEAMFRHLREAPPDQRPDEAEPEVAAGEGEEDAPDDEAEAPVSS
ncbi:DUF3306 domain-containing protein [Arenibaculum sp.]|jgi:hypothetical protein|uniref:DUF3306 domain-containing protein n=1 Tax=Arenibaculum sp. TaxID=2865862 RepID=UPI002E10E3AE|nr:DUF3306 domain-containing protein [Arenibaculum sp.]